MALRVQAWAFPTDSALPFDFQIAANRRTSFGANARNPRWAFTKFPELQWNCGKVGSLPARSRIKSFGDVKSEEKKGGRVGDRDGVIIVDHGSRRRESNLMLNEFVMMFRDRTGYPIVEPAHMELAEPSIKDAFSLCVQQGASRVIISPFFLFPGRHWHQDIPSLAAKAAKDHPGILYIVTAPLGLHELLVDVLNDRINHCLNHAVGDAEECMFCAGTEKSQSTAGLEELSHVVLYLSTPLASYYGSEKSQSIAELEEACCLSGIRHCTKVPWEG